ncbi:probable myosin-binding protein 6 [Arachis stenosperma]|uniref:probable myosin-binding protein 6 n=1 Tax=Arachis stenosperma TaxID=217475 RepID=UPI0025ACEA94|nr:probable myosin-binding protein 6 [Arachis stenosperma]
MDLHESHSWTLGGLIGAFIDLVIAYFLLCGSAFAFFASKFFWFFGLFMPCPCKGSFGYMNSTFCVHKLLFEWPSTKICSIQVMAVNRFPFDLVRVKGHSCGNDRDVVELEDEASCSSCSGPRLLPLVENENGYDAKGKRVMSLKRRSGIRRRRRANNYGSGKLTLVSCSDSMQSNVASTSLLPCDDGIAGKTKEKINPDPRKEVAVLDVDDVQTGHDLDVKTCDSYEFNGSMVDSPGQDKCSSLLENYINSVRDAVQVHGNGEERIKILEDALEEEKAAYAALYLELEKERAAAATAADEAMAMISRLQEEKASMEMEMRQYQRMIEERFTYDEEEMIILQEILIRRERENHFLEKELEAYRQMGLRGSDRSNNGKPRVLSDEWEQALPIMLETHEEVLQNECTISVKKDEPSNISSDYMLAPTCISMEGGEMRAKDIEHDTEPDVLDVHVVDDNIELREQENKTNNNIVSKCPRTGNDSGRDSSCLNNNEKLKIDTEIEKLGERLKMIQHEKGKLYIFAENGESERVQSNLLEEISGQILQTKELRNIARGASLPPSSVKVSLRKRRCQSASWESSESS